MIYRNFNINIIFRLLLIILTAIWLAFEINNPQKAYTKFFIVSLILLQSALLIHYFNKINTELIRFLKILKNDDSAYRFRSDLKGNFAELAKILNNTADLIEITRIEKEKQYHFLQFVIEQINIGLIAFDNNGKVHFTNKSFTDLFKMNRIEDIHAFDRINKQLVKVLLNSKPQDLQQLKINIDNNIYQLLIQKKQFKFNHDYINLVSFQNISAELDKKELESWQKIIRVLTHEIMNSIAPIANLTYSIRRSLTENINPDLDQNSVIQEAIEDTDIIERRSNNLLQFVENYRKLTKVGNANINKLNLNRLFENIMSLFKEDFKSAEIDCELKISSDIEIYGDEKLLEQAIINIIKNSKEALVKVSEPKILVFSEQEDKTISILIKDNGIGIPEDKLEDIFIPFYSSKENGSGIGLSLVKQIINLHKGTVSVSSKPGEGTEFKIIL